MVESLLMGAGTVAARPEVHRHGGGISRSGYQGDAHHHEGPKECVYSDDVRYGNCIATALGWTDITAFILNTGFAGDGKCFITYDYDS
jgi:hypothetical protein